MLLACAVPRPYVGDADAGIGVDGVVPCKVQAEEHGHRLLCAGGQVDQEVHFGTIFLAGEVDGHLLSDCLAPQRLFVDRGKLEGCLFRAGGTAAVDVRLEELKDLRPALLVPGLGVANALAVVQNQRIGQSVFRDFGFVVVDVLALGARGRASQK
jgi:hypothetical protein